MANIVITSDTDYVYLDYNDFVCVFSQCKIRKSDIVSVSMLSGDQGVEIAKSSGEATLIKHMVVDEVDGFTTITTNQILFDKVKVLM